MPRSPSRKDRVAHYVDMNRGQDHRPLVEVVVFQIFVHAGGVRVLADYGRPESTESIATVVETNAYIARHPGLAWEECKQFSLHIYRYFLLAYNTI